MRRPIQMLGFSLAGFLCVALAMLKLTSEVHWSWWRVLLPLWLVLGHNILLYVTVGFVWIYLAEHGTKGEKLPSSKTMTRTVTNWGRCCVSSFSWITAETN
jgi:hypothetical protein